MAKYTTEVRSICEDAYTVKMIDDSSLKPLEDASINSIIDAGIKRIFWQDEDKFEIYNEEHRNELCRKILRHYYTREIGAETFGLWKLWVNERMSLIMPYFNKLYESAELKFNPLYNIDIRRNGYNVNTEKGKNTIDKNEEHISVNNESNVENKKDKINRKNNEQGFSDNSSVNKENKRLNENSKGNEIDNNEEYKRFSDTPQNGLEDVRDGRYLTNAEVNSNTIQKSNENAGEKIEENDNKNTSTNLTQVNGVEDIENDSNINRQSNNVGQSQTKNGSVENITNDKAGNWNSEEYGKTGEKSFSKMIQEYRETILNIDAMIVEKLKDLFILLW